MIQTYCFCHSNFLTNHRSSRVVTLAGESVCLDIPGLRVKVLRPRISELFIGNQQYTARNLKFTGCTTAVQMIWDWGFNWQQVRLYYKLYPPLYTVNKMNEG